jgi:hypothetical protein
MDEDVKEYFGNIHVKSMKLYTYYMLKSILFTKTNMTIILGHNFKVLKAQRDILIHTWTM